MKLKKIKKRGRRKESVMSQFKFLDGLCKRRRLGDVTEEFFIGEVEFIAENALDLRNYWIGLGE